MQGIGQLNLGNNSNLYGLSSSSFGSTSTATYLLYKGTWEGEVLMEDMHLLHHAGTCHHSPLSLKSSRSTGLREDTESSVSCVLSA